MFENLTVMKEIRRRGFPTTYSQEDLVKTVISLEDPKMICYYLNANKGLPIKYIKALIKAVILYNNPRDMTWFDYTLKVANRMPAETLANEEVAQLLADIRQKTEMYSAYYRGYDF